MSKPLLLTAVVNGSEPPHDARFVEERSQTGEYEARREDTVALFMQGCCGNVSPALPRLSPNWPGRSIYSRDDYESVVQLGKYLANQIKAAVDSEGAKLEGAKLKGFIHMPPTPQGMLKPDYSMKRGDVDLCVTGLRFANQAVLIGVGGELLSEYRTKRGLRRLALASIHSANNSHE